MAITSPILRPAIVPWYRPGETHYTPSFGGLVTKGGIVTEVRWERVHHQE